MNTSVTRLLTVAPRKSATEEYNANLDRKVALNTKRVDIRTHNFFNAEFENIFDRVIGQYVHDETKEGFKDGLWSGFLKELPQLKPHQLLGMTLGTLMRSTDAIPLGLIEQLHSLKVDLKTNDGTEAIINIVQPSELYHSPIEKDDLGKLLHATPPYGRDGLGGIVRFLSSGDSGEVEAIHYHKLKTLPEVRNMSNHSGIKIVKLLVLIICS